MAAAGFAACMGAAPETVLQVSPSYGSQCWSYRNPTISLGSGDWDRTQPWVDMRSY